MLGTPRRTLAALAVTALAASACSTTAQTAPDPSGSSRSSESSGQHGQITPSSAQAAPEVTTVIAVSIDGLNSNAIRQLGAERTPTLHRLIDGGASTLNARTEREQTNTLPNHTGMLTGRRIAADSGGHGVTWNDERLEPRTVQEAAGHPVSSVFSVVDSHERDTGLFASKQKFSLFERSWDAKIDRFVVREDNLRLTRQVRADIADKARTFRFVHLSAPDVAGHAHGFMTPAYLDAVAATDHRLGRIIAAVEAKGDLADHTVVVVTADHGGRGVSHRNPTRLYNYRVPFIVWGAGVAPGKSLYALNPDYANPGTARTTYDDAKQPVRNGDVANLVTDLLGLKAVPGSEHDSAQDLDWN